METQAHIASLPTVFPAILDTTRSLRSQLRPVPLHCVQLRDRFWQPRRLVNRDVTLPSQYEQCREKGYFDNFERAAGRSDKPFQGLHWNDSDVYKWLEAASWTLADADSPAALRDMVELVSDQIAAMQQPDGYLHSYFQFDKSPERFTWLENSHELYNFGHFIQAAIAHHRSTGSSKLLEVAQRLGDFLYRTFGPQEAGKHPQTDGHQEIELALVELYRTTGEIRYLETAQFFVAIRARGGVKPIPQLEHLGLSYHQSHLPLEEQSEAVGHAVRALYYYCGGADLVLEGNNDNLYPALRDLWQNVTGHKMYISGGVGSRHDGESFGTDYELPNATAYCETCAAIALVMWAWRMLHLDPRAAYADVMERALYNGVLSGISFDGQKYFYVNPLQSGGTHRRQEWFGCACCPPNIARLLAQLPGYFASTSSSAVWLHFYAQAEEHLILPDGSQVRLNVHTSYPWDGEIEIEVQEASGPFAMLLRIPSWCREPRLQINGQEWDPVPGMYQKVDREWKAGDKVLLQLPMPAVRIESHPAVLENRGQVALMRGPLLYCFEGCDHQVDLAKVTLPATALLQTSWRDDLLNGVIAINTTGEVSDASTWPMGTLYRESTTHPGVPVSLTAVPYYAWANRETGPMRVWLHQSSPPPTS